MKKQINVLLVISIFLCLLLSSIVYISGNKESNAIKESSSGLPKDVENLDYLSTFDVSDFTGTKENTIDIAAKKYFNNSISIADTDFRISDSLMTKIMNTIDSYGKSSSFYIVSLNDGMSVAYNVDQRYETASSIKEPYALYVYEEIDKGNINPDEKIAYETYMYNKGTGIIKNSAPGTEYTIRNLVFYALHESDNVAHEMLHRRFGVKGYNDMLRNLGTKELYLTAGNPWGMTSCRSAALVWQETYNFSIRSNEGITLLNILSNGKYNYYKEIMPNIPSASKTGFANYDVVETGIVFDKSPYIAIAMANKGGNIGAYTQVLKLISLMNDIMNEYNNYLLVH